MLEAKKNFLFEKIFIRYNRGLLTRRFASVNVSGLEFLENRNPEIPLIVCANHSSWWDGLVVLELLSNFKFDNYVMMEEKQLRKLRFFRRLGAFSVNRSNFRDALKSINYSVKILSEKKNRTVLIFPQGAIFHNDIRPLVFFSGLAKVIEQIGTCKICPINIRYEFLGKFKPDIFIAIGEPLTFNFSDKVVRKTTTSRIEAVMTFHLDNLKQKIIKNDFDNFKKIL